MPKGKPVSLFPLSFDEAMGKLIAVRPPTEKKKRKKAKGRSSSPVRK